LPNADRTFREQADKWLADLTTRKRKPVSPATLRAFGSYVRRLTPIIGDMPLADINNGTLKQLVQRLHEEEKLSAKSIHELVVVVKQVVASPVDQETGEPIFKREWSARFIDCPTVATQKQPCVSTKDVERCLKESSSDQEKVLYAVLAGTGLRIGEALAIHVMGTHDQTSWNPESQSIDVRSSIFNGREIPRLKTAAARRTVDLDPQLNDLIARFVGNNSIQPGGYLFQARSGRAMYQATARQRLAKHRIPGFHAFRRYRITLLRELGVPEDLIRYAVGHSGRGITDRYSKLGENVELRREWSRRAGLGFAIPELYKVPPAPKSSKSSKGSKASSRAESATSVEAITEVVSYQATEDDLPVELFEKPTELCQEED
jgi:integrase